MEKRSYSNTLLDFANIDNRLGASQRTIGESSNVAQIAQSYTSSSCFDDKNKVNDYVCILSVLAQISIDSSKRQYATDLVDEITRIKQELNVKENGYPAFWLGIRKGFNKKKINQNLECAMNIVYGMTCKSYKPKTGTLPVSDFLMTFTPEKSNRRCEKVEELIDKYAFKLGKYNHVDENDDTYWLLCDEFDNMLSDIRQTYISKNYAGLMSWLIQRALIGSNNQKSGISHNKSLLFKTLYRINPKQFLACFSKNMQQDSQTNLSSENLALVN